MKIAWGYFCNSFEMMATFAGWSLFWALVLLFTVALWIFNLPTKAWQWSRS